MTRTEFNRTSKAWMGPTGTEWDMRKVKAAPADLRGRVLRHLVSRTKMVPEALVATRADREHLACAGYLHVVLSPVGNRYRGGAMHAELHQGLVQLTQSERQAQRNADRLAAMRHGDRVYVRGCEAVYLRQVSNVGVQPFVAVMMDGEVDHITLPLDDVVTEAEEKARLKALPKKGRRKQVKQAEHA